MPSVSLWAFSAENYFLLQISQPCGAGLFAFSQKKLLLVQRAVAWDRFHSFYKNHRRRGRSAGPEGERGVSTPPSLPLDTPLPATRKGLLAPFRPQRGRLQPKIRKIHAIRREDLFTVFSASTDWNAPQSLRASSPVRSVAVKGI